MRSPRAMTRRAQRSFAAFSWPQVRRTTTGGVCQLARSQAADQHEHKPEPEVTAKWHESGRGRVGPGEDPPHPAVPQQRHVIDRVRTGDHPTDRHAGPQPQIVARVRSTPSSRMVSRVRSGA